MSGQKIRIAARVRPLLPQELHDGSVQVTNERSSAQGGSASGSSISVANPRDTSQIFKFPLSSCYDGETMQEEIFERDVRGLIDVVYSGVTVTVFAYGVTSSGKTHTMQGTRADPGIIPRTVDALFARKDAYSIPGEVDVSLSVSYIEIYKDECYDLLVTRQDAPKLPVREDASGKVFVANLDVQPINTPSEFHRIYDQATGNRSVASTNLNRASSRSHAVLTIMVDIVNRAQNTTLSGKINLVDLAGSENNKLTGNDPSRMLESSAINKSLSVLGQVVHALNKGDSRIPYRNSKLTRILQDALGGESVGLLICNIAPGIKFRQDTLNTLNFASRTRNIENKPVINERDNKPAPKRHFSAPSGPAIPLKLAPIQPTASGSGGRPSMVPKPRYSTVGGGRPSMVPSYSSQSGPSFKENFKIKSESISEDISSASGSGMGTGLSEKEIDERISKAVEIEVARRLAERERQEEELKRLKKEELANQSPRKMPSGVLTPILKRHKDLDQELTNRLEELERRYERGSKEFQLADALSPVSRKKTGRAYVALARSHSEKGDLQVALDMYRKAESYVPDNHKLRERILEIEYAVKTDKPFVPSPPKKQKKQHKSKGRGKKRSATPEANDDEEEEEVAMSLDQGLGLSLEPATPPSKDKRARDSPDLEEGSASKKMKLLWEETPPPALRRSPRKRSQPL